jgi:oxaloacetate decarboxylase gamma subunit
LDKIRGISGFPDTWLPNKTEAGFNSIQFGGSMTILEMLGQSGSLTVLGMGVVFGFLAIMVICVTIMGKIMHALGADKDVIAPGSDAQVSSSASATAKTTAVTAAITAAVAEYQKDNS